MMIGRGLIGCVLALALAGSAQARTIALLVGVGAYDDRDITALKGPPYDVAAMRDLVQTHMGAAPQDVHVLVDHQASQAAILREFADLVHRSAPGDRVVIYFSGHGTSARDPNSNTGLPMGTSAWIPADFNLAAKDHIPERLVTGRLHLLPLVLKPLDEGGRSVLVISDSCYSGNIVRGIGGGVSKYVPIGDPGPAPADKADLAPAPYPYHHVIMVAASADTEPAHDLDDMADTPTIDGKPKGALTNALLRIFSGLRPADFNHDGQVSFVELQRALREDLAAMHQAQSPQVLPTIDQDGAGITYLPVPGVAAMAVAGQVHRVAVEIPADDAALTAMLHETSDLHAIDTNGDFVVKPGGAGRYDLYNGTHDLVAQAVGGDALVARLRAAAWVGRVLAGAKAPIALAADSLPSAKGGTFVIGRDRLLMALKADRAAWFLVVDIDPQGKISTLMPIMAGENRVYAGGELQRVPDTPIKATLPAGLDQVLVLAFAHAPAGIEAWFRLAAPFGSAEATGFADWLAASGQAYAAATIDIRTVLQGGSGE